MSARSRGGKHSCFGEGVSPVLLKMKNYFLIALCLASFVALAGCNPAQDSDSSTTGGTDGDNGQAQVNTELAGKIEIDGSSTVYPITEAAAAEFKKRFPNVNIVVGVSGTGGGFNRFVSGDTDISDASRPIKSKEFKACKENQTEFVELPVAYDGLTIVVSKENDFVKQLTVDQLKQIFLDGTTAKSWKDINSAWEDKPIKIFAPGTDSGTFDYFKEVVAGKTGSIRGDMSTSEDDHVLVNGVAGDKYALGFFGAAYYFQNEDKLNSVKIVNPEGVAVAPTAETIENGSYAPFSRPLFIYLNKNSLDKAQVEKFVDFYLENAGRFAKQVGYVPLPEAVGEEAFSRFENVDTGTHYLTAEMEKRMGPVMKVYKKENLQK